MIPRPGPGRTHKLTPEQRATIREDVSARPRGERLLRMKDLAILFKVHWRTIDNAYRGRGESKTPAKPSDIGETT